MKVTLINLSNNKFSDSRKLLNKSAINAGVDYIKSYDFKEIINTPFYKENFQILSQPTGNGYWLWKPYIILETLNKVNEGDIVIYSDCGIKIIANLSPLIDICNNSSEILLFANSFNINKSWTKRDCFILMNCDEEKFWNGEQCDAAFCLFKKNDKTILFIREWLRFCLNPNIITDIKNVNNKPNFSDFIEHRRDQSILSLLAIKYNITLYRMPTQWGNILKTLEYRKVDDFAHLKHLKIEQDLKYGLPMMNSPYNQLLLHHRTKNTTVLQKAKCLARNLINLIKK